MYSCFISSSYTINWSKRWWQA